MKKSTTILATAKLFVLTRLVDILCHFILSQMIEVRQWPPGYDAFQITINGLAQIFKVWQRKYFRFGATRIQIAVFLNSFVVANS